MRNHVNKIYGAFTGLSLASLLCMAPLTVSHAAGVVLAPKTPQQHQAAKLLVEGATFLKAKKLVQARPLIEKAATLWPESAHVQFNLGLLYGEMGNLPRAVAAYQKAYQLDPRLLEAIPNVGTCYQMMNQPDKAVYWFQEYLKRAPNAPDAAQVRSMITALKKAAQRQVGQADPAAPDYLTNICANGRIQRWPRHKLPLKIYISNGTDEQGNPVKGFRGYYNEILLQALDTWIKASQYRLAYVFVDDVHQADIACTWTDRQDFLQGRGNAVEQGVARVAARPISRTEEEIGHVRVIILIADATTHNNITDDELKKACLHELGHAFGFAGHSNNNRDVMFYSESPTIWAALTKRDKATIARLYADYPPQQPADTTPDMPSEYDVNSLAPSN